MKNIILTASLLSVFSISYASYILNVPLEQQNGGALPSGSIIMGGSSNNVWLAILPAYTVWSSTGTPYNCLTWNPDPSEVPINKLFTQESNDCSIQQSRTKQNQEKNKLSGAVRNVGNPITESKIVNNAHDTRSATGIRESWNSTTPIYTAWIDSGIVSGCSNWSPSPATVGLNVNFTQTATDCQQPQTRTRQDREQEVTTLNYRNVGNPVEEKQSILATTSRSAIGEKATWTATTPVYTDWVDVGSIQSCSNWSPSPSTVAMNVTFTQTATNCTQVQTRDRQNREQETNTLEYRNVGEVIVEQQTISATKTRESKGTKENWIVASPTYTAWENSEDIYNCSNWSPAISTVKIGVSFTQTATDCKQNQVRQKQNREQESTTLEYRNVGQLVAENKTITVSDTRSSIGTLESWKTTTPLYTTWINSGTISSCTNWSPSVNTVKTGSTFTQTATDCKQTQTRNRQDREQETTTLAFRNVGSPVIENQIITVNDTRSATGTMEAWVSTTPVYTAWVNTGSVTSCSNWSPATNTVTVNTSFTQTATDCQQAQTRNKQNREQETTTLAYRNVGSPIVENQSITVTNTRTATGIKETWVAATSTYTTWVNSGAITSCTNWSPAVTTVNTGTVFTQTATDCKQPQTRSRQDREQETTTLAYRNVGASVVENQSIATTSTRSATGTLENWVAAVPTYTAWVSSGTITSCTNWSPAVTTVNKGTTFTQTATDCKQTQTRSRQDRQQETNTLVYRNSGSPVVESQVVTVNDNRSAIGTKELWAATTPTYTAWVNNGAINSCSNWSPLANTVTINSSFTQTATDCKQPQTRSRQDREQEANTLAYRNVGVPVTETQNVTVTSTQSAIGTKETWIASTPTYTAWVNNGALTGCSNWSPATSGVDFGLVYTQTATNCLQPQTRSRQDRQRETTTLAYRNSGSPVVENQNITATSTRSASGTYPAIRNNPLSRFNSSTGINRGNSVSTNGVSGALMYGPYVKNFPAGRYRLTVYGTVVSTGGAAVDVVTNGSNQIIWTGGFADNTSGVIVDQIINTPTINDIYGIEIRVMVNNPSNITVTGYTFTPY